MNSGDPVRPDVLVPDVLGGAGLAVPGRPDAARHIFDYFAARIRNRNTRAAYLVALRAFSTWCTASGTTFARISPGAVSGYLRSMPGGAAKRRQHLAAIRALGDWLVVNGVLERNPAAPVRLERRTALVGLTPVLSAGELRIFLDAIDLDTVAGLRDHAFVSVMLYAFARVGAVVALRPCDYRGEPGDRHVRLYEKRGLILDVPVHDCAEESLDRWLEGPGPQSPADPLFQGVNPAGVLNGRSWTRRLAHQMVKRRAAAAGLPAGTTCHSFRAGGITAYLNAGGTLDHARRIAGHASTATTKLYDRTSDRVSAAEIRRIKV